MAIFILVLSVLFRLSQAILRQITLQFWKFFFKILLASAVANMIFVLQVQVANSTPLCDPAIKSKIPSENGGFGGGGSSGCPSNYASNCLMGCDLNQYFKEPIDTDGLTAHHNQVQERLVRIFASHQAEVQALRRDLQCTRVALFKHKSLLSSSRGMMPLGYAAGDAPHKTVISLSSVL